MAYSKVKSYRINEKMNNKINSKKATRDIIDNDPILKHKKNITEEQKLDYIEAQTTANIMLDQQLYKNVIEFDKYMKVIASRYTYEKPEKYLKPYNAQEVYRGILPFFNRLIEENKAAFEPGNKTNTGSELIKNTIEYNNGISYSMLGAKANTSIQSLNKSYDTFKKLDSFYAFDLETLSGLGATGYNELDKLQEISFRRFEKTPDGLKEIVEDRIETLVGIDDKEYNYYKELLFDKDGNLNLKGVNKNKVIAERFGKLGNEKYTKIKYHDNGLATVESFAPDDPENLNSINISKGLKKAKEIGKIQEATINPNTGLQIWQQKLFEGMKTFNDNFVVGYNSTEFDFEKLNQQAARVWGGLDKRGKAYVSNLLGLKSGEIPIIKPKDGMYMDLRDVMRIAASSVGAVGIYDDDNKSLENVREAGLTLLQQESIRKLLPKETLERLSKLTAAHSAGADVTVLAHLMSAGVLDKVMNIVNKNASNIEGTISKNEKTVLMATNSPQFNTYNRKGALNFTYDSFGDTIRLSNGFSIANSGVDEGTIDYSANYLKNRGVKRNTLYTLGFAGEIEMTEEWVDKISKIHQDYAQGRLWTIALNPLNSEDIAEENEILRNPIFYLFTSKEAMEGFLSGNFDNLGKWTSEGYVMPDNEKAKQEIFDRYSINTIENGKLITEKYDAKTVTKEEETNFIFELLDKSTEDRMNDTISRGIKENEYSKAAKFLNLEKEFSSRGIINPIDQKNILQKLTKKEMVDISSLVSSQISTGTPLKFEKQIVLDTLGYFNKKTALMNLQDSTFNNAINSWEFMSSRKKVLNKAIKEVDSYKDASDTKKQMIYDNLITGLQEAMRLEYPGIEPTVPVEVYGKDLDYFEFDMPDGYFKPISDKSLPDIDGENTLRVGLKPGSEYSLVNELLERRRGYLDDDREFKELYGQQELVNFIKELNESEEYKGLFNDLLYGPSKDTIYDSVISDLRDSRTKANEEYRTAIDNAVNMYSRLINTEEELSKTDPNIKTLSSLREKVTNLRDRQSYLTEQKRILEESLLDKINSAYDNDVTKVFEQIKDPEKRKYFFEQRQGIVESKKAINKNPTVVDFNNQIKELKSQINSQDKIYKNQREELKNKLIDELKNTYDTTVNGSTVNVYSPYDKKLIKKRKQDIANQIKNINSHPDIIAFDEAYNLKKGELNKKREELISSRNKFKSGILGDLDSQYDNILEDIKNSFYDKRESAEKTKKDLFLQRTNMYLTPELKEIMDELYDIDGELEVAYGELFDKVDSLEGFTGTNSKKVLNEASAKYTSTLDDLNAKISKRYNELLEENGDSWAPAKSNIGANALGSYLIRTLKGIRKKFPEKGLPDSRDKAYVLGKDTLLENVDDETFKVVADKVREEMFDYIEIDKSDPDEVSKVARQLVDDIIMPKVKDKNGNVLSNIDEIADFAEKVYGYNQPTSKAFKTSLEMIREEHIKGYEKIIGAITGFGGTLSYSSKTGKMVMAIGEERSVLDMPKTIFTNGMLGLKLGDQVFGVNFKFDVKSHIKGDKLNDGAIKVTSSVKDLYKDIDNIYYAMRRTEKDSLGNPKKMSNAFFRGISGMFSELRESPVLGRSTTKDRTAWQHIDYSEIITGAAYRIKDLQAYDKWEDPTVVDVFKKNAESIKKGFINSEVREAFGREWQDITKIVIGKGGGSTLADRDFEEFAIKNTNIYIKQNRAAEGEFFLGDYSIMTNLRANENARPPATSADEINYRLSDVNKFIKNNKDLGFIEANTRLVTDRTKHGLFFEGIGEVANGITFENAMISEIALKEVMSAEVDKQIQQAQKAGDTVGVKKLNKLKDQLSSINLTEQEKIIDGRLANFLFSNTETQRITMLKDFNMNVEVANRMMNKRVRKAMPKMEMVDGSIVFSLGKGQYVNHNDPLLTINKYGGGTYTLGVKEDAGFFKMGYFGKESNIQVTEEEISKFLNNNIQDFLNPDGTINKYKVDDALAREYRREFFIENAFLKGTNKGTLEYSEKSMYTALLTGAGNIDEEVGKTLDFLGLNKAKGRILGDEYIEYARDVFEKSKETNPFMKNSAFKTADEFVKAINAEKYMKSDFIQSIPGFKGILSAGNDKVLKHGNVGTALNYFINNLAYLERGKDKKLSVSDSYKKAFDIITENNIFQNYNISFDDKTGRIVFGESIDTRKEKILIKNIEDYAEKSGMYGPDSDLSIKTADGRVIGRRYIGTMTPNVDYSGTSRWEGEAEKVLEKIKSTRKSLRELDVDSVEYAKVSDKLLGLQRKYDAMMGKNKTMKISNREINLLELYDYNEENVVAARKALGDDQLFNKLYGGSRGILTGNFNLKEEHKGAKLYSNLLEDIGDKLYMRASKHLGQYKAVEAAVKFNASNDSISLKALQDKHGFTMIKLKDLVTAEGEDTSFLADNKNRSFGQNIIIDTGNKNQRYIAVTPTMFSDSKTDELGDSVNEDSVQRAIRKYTRVAERYSEALEGDEKALNGRTVADIESQMLKAGQGIKDAMVGGAKGLRKDLEGVHLDRYSYEKASMISIDDKLPYYMFNKSEIEGLKISDWQKKGIHYDATWHSKEYFRDLGYFSQDKLNQYGFANENQMMDYLETYGTVSLDVRTPSIQEGSANVVRTFLDRGLEAKQSKSMVYTGLSRNQDQDGDSIIGAELSHTADDGRKFTFADYKRAMQQNQGDTLDEGTHKYFEGIMRAQNQRAILINRKIYEGKQKPDYIAETEKALDNANIAKVIRGKNADLNGEYINSMSFTALDTSKRNMHIERYNDLQETLRDSMGREEFNKLSDYNKNKAMRNYVNNITDEAKRGSMVEMLDDMEIYNKEVATLMSKITQKASIGFINTPLAVMRRVSSTLGVASEDKKYLQGMARVFEQGIISKKHDVQTAMSITQQFRESLDSILYNKQEDGKAQAGIEYIKSLINDERYRDDLYEEMAIFSDVNTNGMSKKQVTDRMNEALSSFYGKIQNRRDMDSLIASEKAASILGAENIDIINIGTGYSEGTVPKALTRAGVGVDSKAKVNRTTNMNDFSRETREMAKDIGDAIGDATKAMTTSTSGLGLAALGLAGAIMAVGYIGGNPSKPADNQAEDEEYESLQDEDLSIQSVPKMGGTNQGYVININAESDRGQQHVYEAVQKAMQSSIPTDINISMNMNDKTGNISTRLIDKLMAGAL